MTDEKKSKVIKTCENLESVPLTKKQVQEHNKILKSIFVGVGAVIIFILAWTIVSNYTKYFDYNGVEFKIEKYCDAGPCLTLYQTSIPIKQTDHLTGKVTEADYNFYLRKDPRTLKDIDFDGELLFSRNMVINMSGDLNCDGDGVIAVANLLNLYKLVSIDVIKDSNAICDAEGRYMFVQIQSSDVSGIEQTGPMCYTLNVNNCEILDVTEKLMIESFAEINDKLGF